jgi:hypothetical protein
LMLTPDAIIGTNPAGPPLFQRISSSLSIAQTSTIIIAKTIYTNITPLPAGVSREVVLETLDDHLEMIDHTGGTASIRCPKRPTKRYHCTWYQITDKISYLPGVKGSVSFKTCFHDLSNGMQNNVYTPMGLDIKEKWTLG